MTAALTTLVSFNGANGESPEGSLIADSNGDLFGTTSAGGGTGGTGDDGTVFELVNNGTVAAPSYASTPTTLVSFNKSNGVLPEGSLIADVNGDLFGTTRVSLVHGSSGCSVDRTVWTLGGSGSRRAAFSPENPALLQLALPLISSPSC